MLKNHEEMSGEELYIDLTNDEDTPIEGTGAEQSTADIQHEAHAEAGKDSNAGKDNHEGQQEQGQQGQREHSAQKENVYIRKVYSHHSLADLVSTPAPIEYFIDDYIQKAATHMLFGDSGSGKTFVAVDIALHIACPDLDTWCNKDIEHGTVIFFAGEGTHGIKKRFKGAIMEHNINPAMCPIEVIDECFYLNDSKNEDYSIQNTIDNIRAIYEKPALIVVDTLHRFFEGSENDSQDIGTFIHACDLLVREFGCAVLIIHHTGNAQETKGRGRGSSSLRCDIDNELKVETIGDHIKIDQTKRKEGEKITGLILDRKEVTLPPEWNRKNGRPETTLVLKLSPNSNPNKFGVAQTTKKETELKPAQKRARETYTQAAKKFGVRIHDEETGHDLVAVNIDDWEKVSYELSIAKKEHAKEMEYNRDRTRLVLTDKLLTKRIIEGAEYYCLDLQAEGEDMMRIEIITALVAREKQQGAGGAIGH